MNQIAKVEEICNETRTVIKWKNFRPVPAKRKKSKLKKNQQRLFI